MIPTLGAAGAPTRAGADPGLGPALDPSRSAGLMEPPWLPPWDASEAGRAEFPILGRQVSGRPLVYLDSAATTQKPRCVLNRMARYYEGFNANVHRGMHTLAAEATRAYEEARDALARHLNAWDRRGVIFTRNFTEAANLVAYAWARHHLRPGDEILSSVAEHHSNLVPWQLAAADTGATLRYLEITPEGHLDLDALPRLISPRTRLVAVTAMSNVLGARVDVARIVAAARAVGARVFLDAAQLAPHGGLDARALDVDFLGLSAHKMLGPTGIGALVGRPELLADLPPFMGGGEMIAEVTLEGATWNEIPWRFEAGTPMIAEAVGWHAALDYLERVGPEALADYEAELTAQGLAALEAVPGLTLYGPRDATRGAPLFAFNVMGEDGALLHPADVGMVLDKLGIAVRVGHHCAQPLHARLGVPGSVRASAYVYNQPADLYALAEGVLRARRLLSGARARAGAERPEGPQR